MRICVYCSSSSAVAGVYNRAARELGRLIASRGHTLVYGGCDVGTMGELARAATVAGGRVVGVIPKRFQEYGLAYTQADETLVTDTLAERKALMVHNADAFVAMPGGLGTLDELSEVLTLKQLGEVHGPVTLLNIEGFYEHLLAHFERLYQLCFARPEYRQLYHVASTAAEALEYIENYQQEALPDKWI